jgi:hypothetical protein
MQQPHRSDRSSDDLVRRPGDICGAFRRQDRESGQATTEFALILLPLLLLVAGIIQFGIALNYWLDMQRAANQGARFASVNNWPPDCPKGSAAGTCGNWPGTPAKTLQQYIVNAAIADGLRDAVVVEVCYPNSDSQKVGDPVKVHLEVPFSFVPIVEVGTITLSANATMRLEQSQEAAKGGLITGEVGPTC